MSSNSTYRLQAIAKKCGLIAYRCAMLDGSIPDYRLRLKVQREVSRITFEHILVFTARRQPPIMAVGAT
jgi:hypothetical protein